MSECDGYCGTDLGDADNVWGLRLPDDTELGFCSLECMASWLDEAQR